MELMMEHSQISDIDSEYTFVKYTDNNDVSGWFGYSGWFRKYILGREFSIYTTPQSISRDDVKILKLAITLYDLGKISIWEIRKLK